MRSLSQDIVINAKQAHKIYLSELWLYRELFYFFAWRDIKVRYKQTVLGIGWAVLQPLIIAGIFTLFFNRVAKFDSGSVDVPYPVFVYLGLTYWYAFSAVVNNVSNSILTNIGVINKIYFPRIILPMSAIVLGIIDFVFAIFIFFLLVFVFQVNIQILGLLVIIPSLILILLAAFAIGLLFAALNAKYRDIRSALPYIIQATFFLTPVIYPVSMIPEKFQIFTYINPAAGAISSVKNALFGQPIVWDGLLISWVAALIILAIGVFAFNRAERNFPDYL